MPRLYSWRSCRGALRASLVVVCRGLGSGMSTGGRSFVPRRASAASLASARPRGGRPRARRQVVLRCGDVATRRLDALAERWRSRRARVARPALASVTMGVPRRNPDAPARDRTHRGGARAPSRWARRPPPTSAVRASSSSPRARAKPPRGAAGVERLRLLPLWEHRPGAEPQQYAVDNGAVRLLLPEEADYLKDPSAPARERRRRRDRAPASSSPSSSSDPSDASDAVPEWVALQRRRADRLATRA